MSALRQEARPPVALRSAASEKHPSPAVEAVANAVAERVSEEVTAVVRQLAARIDELEQRLAAEAPIEQAGTVDARALAQLLGVSRHYVYEHADELGALRLGDGPKARLRFDVGTARAAIARGCSERSQHPETPVSSSASAPRGRGARRRLPAGVPAAGSILTARGASR